LGETELKPDILSVMQVMAVRIRVQGKRSRLRGRNVFKHEVTLCRDLKDM
jgi:hypothetical protein